MVYRNEDTGWGWPPYFKFDTTNLQAEAADLRSTAAAPQWAIMTHYGWRNEFLSIFPNAIGIRAVDDPGRNHHPVGQHHHPDLPRRVLLGDLVALAQISPRAHRSDAA